MNYYEGPHCFQEGGVFPASMEALTAGREKTMAYRILRAHETGTQKDGQMHIRFDALISMISPTWELSRPPEPAA